MIKIKFGKIDNHVPFKTHSSFDKAVELLIAKLYIGSTPPKSVVSSKNSLLKKREILVLKEIASLLGKNIEDTVVEMPSYDFLAESFTSRNHPFGNFVEVALKAAYGMTAEERPLVPIDQRMWFHVAEFRVSLPKTQFRIDYEDLSYETKALAEAICSRTSGLLTRIFGINATENEAQDEVVEGLRILVNRTTNSEADGVLMPVSFSIVVEGNDSLGRNLGSTHAKREIELNEAATIAKAIERRVNTRLERFGWEGACVVEVIPR